jgi:ribosome-binding protein aMBF1 (putative translation factor)
MNKPITLAICCRDAKSAEEANAFAKKSPAYRQILREHPSSEWDRRYVSSLPPGDMIRLARYEAGLTLRELAKLLGLKGPSQLSEYETGKVQPSIKRATEILDAMGYDLRIDVVKRA